MYVIQEISEIENINNWFIVDMGYSNSRKSCGILKVYNNQYIPEDVSFSSLEDEFRDFYKECGNKKIGLILEAPLSIFFDSNRNPYGREFEKEYGEEKTKKGDNKITAIRYWYSGAGATVTLGALEFISRIKDILTSNVCLFEGFVSFKDDNDTDKQKEEHYKDAERLFNATKNYELHEPINDAEKYIFIGSYLNLKINGIPPIIKVSKDKNEIFMI